MENARIFFEQTIKSEQAKELLMTCEKPTDREAALRLYVKIAEQLGVTLTLEEVRAYFSEGKVYGEVDDAELSQVVGGARVRDRCRSSYLNQENCIWNDGCDYLWNQYNNYSCSRSYVGACAMFSATDSDSDGKNKTGKLG